MNLTQARGCVHPVGMDVTTRLTRVQGVKSRQRQAESAPPRLGTPKTRRFVVGPSRRDAVWPTRKVASHGACPMDLLEITATRCADPGCCGVFGATRRHGSGAALNAALGHVESAAAIPLRGCWPPSGGHWHNHSPAFWRRAEFSGMGSRLSRPACAGDVARAGSKGFGPRRLAPCPCPSQDQSRRPGPPETTRLLGSNRCGRCSNVS